MAEKKLFLNKRWLAAEYAQPLDGGRHDCIDAPSKAIGVLHGYMDDEDTRYADGGADRCFRIFNPHEAAPKGLPVVVYFHEMLDRAVHACQEKSPLDLAEKAKAHGFALVCADANVLWDIPEPKKGQEGICGEEASQDHLYVSHLLDVLKSDKSLDPERIFFAGHSEGAAFATWASFCFASQIRGFASSGYGLKLHGAAVRPSHCKVLSRLGYDCKAGADDGVTVPGGFGSCADCEYSPLKPWKAKNVVGEDLRICLFNGRRDYFRPSTWFLESELKSVKMSYTSIALEGMHQVPTGFGDLLSTCLIEGH
eukprot:CAMPEP_0170608404 /NCGR_PEP_ID=MMETSP0224-20130122/21566_1 /TAXON_ID=285029 /ORGANISM="Togula jolla, Strain CCCM 725" /LENGTH=309 /DNA_ID=CAMNT_0010933627 /DNA_START=79 /DNA_END=1008 /DNA_ORIENTATION=+